MLTTRRLFLMPATLPMLEAAVAQDWDKLSSLLGGVSFAENWSHFPESFPWMLEYMKNHPDEQGWWSYFIIQGLDARIAGTCGFKGKPTPEGAVEMGYEIADRYQNQGLATEAAEALIKYAFQQPAVNTIFAHTLAEENASVHVLQNLNFTFVEETWDIEDGKIWKWQRNKDIDA